MGALNAADAKKWIDTARKVLEELLAKPPEVLYTRFEILGKQEQGTTLRRQTHVLNRLERANILTGVRGSYRTDPVRWGINDVTRAKELVRNSALLSEALWPPQALPESEEPTEEPETIEAALPAAVGDSSAEVLGALAAVLKTLSAVGESLGQLHQKVEKVAVLPDLLLQMSAILREQSKTFTAIAAAAAPRLGELEAKQLKEGDILNYHYAVGGVGPVRVVSVRSAPGAPVCVNVAFLDDKPGKLGTIIPLTPKFLSHRSVT